MKKEQENNKGAKTPEQGEERAGVNRAIKISIIVAIIGGLFGMAQFILPCYVFDGDDDGIHDCYDDCRNPGCSIIDVHGCPQDSDNDSVLDCDDNCQFEKGDIVDNGCPTPPTPLLEITEPAHLSDVEIKQIVKGISQNIPEELNISVIIYCPEVDRYYPQLDSLRVQANGEWQTCAYVGLGEDGGKKFDIIVVLADKKAQDALDEYTREYEETTSQPGLEELPEGAVECDRVSVTRLPCDTEPIANIVIYFVNYKAEGNGKTDLNGEWVEIRNISDQDIDITGWKLYDESNHIYQFRPGFVLKARQSVRVYTGSGNDTASNVYWKRGAPVWNDGGDCAYLADGEGNIVDIKCW